MQMVDDDMLSEQTGMGRLPIFILSWRAVPTDYGFPSMPLGLARDYVKDPEVAKLVARRDGPATERMLLQKMWIIPVIDLRD